MGANLLAVLGDKLKLLSFGHFTKQIGNFHEWVSGLATLGQYVGNLESFVLPNIGVDPVLRFAPIRLFLDKNGPRGQLENVLLSDRGEVEHPPQVVTVAIFLNFDGVLEPNSVAFVRDCARNGCTRVGLNLG